LIVKVVKVWSLIFNNFLLFLLNWSGLNKLSFGFLYHFHKRFILRSRILLCCMDFNWFLWWCSLFREGDCNCSRFSGKPNAIFGNLFWEILLDGEITPVLILPLQIGVLDECLIGYEFANTLDSVGFVLLGNYPLL